MRIPTSTSSCAIGRGRTGRKNGTCFNKSELTVLATHLGLISNKNESGESLYHKISVKLHGIPETEWVNTVIKSKSEKEKYDSMETMVFKPTLIHKGTWSWLTDTDILLLMKQYEHYFNSKKKKSRRRPFEFYGVFSSDFFKLFPRKRLEIKKLLDKGHSIGLVFNLDPHNLPGSHWVGVYMYKNKGNVVAEYFDSYGDHPIKNIDLFLKYFTNKYKYNHIPHQKKNGVCGIYAINFILSRLYGMSFATYNRKLIPDDQVNSLRFTYFRVKS